MPVPIARVLDVRFDEYDVTMSLVNGRTTSVPLAWYPRLLRATPEQRASWERAGGGYGVHWPEVDEDLSTDGLLRGAPAPTMADANSIFTGDKLLTAGDDKDGALFAKLGLTPLEGEEPMRVAAQ